MKFWLYKCGDRESSELGVDWTKCREVPFVTIPKADQPYYDYLHIKFKFVYYWLCVDVYYKKMPYKNLTEYRTFRKLRLTKET